MSASAEIASGQRFEFGQNWNKFVRLVDESRIEHAMRDIVSMLHTEDLSGRTFLDIGCGSGLSSLAARRLGAAVHAFDYDQQCVACARQLKERFRPGDADWIVEQGSVLDRQYLASLGEFDVVYCWGVLHHTGSMWSAMENACQRVDHGGKLFLSIYNDQGFVSNIWRLVKKTYCRSPYPLKLLLRIVIGGLQESKMLAGAVLRRDWRSYLEYQRRRGMDRRRDIADWVGGYPFEVARPEVVFDFCRARDFELQRLVTAGGRLGCNRFVFRKRHPDELQLYRVLQGKVSWEGRPSCPGQRTGLPAEAVNRRAGKKTGTHGKT